MINRKVLEFTIMRICCTPIAQSIEQQTGNQEILVQHTLRVPESYIA